MAVTSDTKLLFSIRYAPVLLVGVFVLIANFVLFHDRHAESAEQISNIHTDIVDKHKQLVSGHIQQLAKYIAQERAYSLQQIKQESKNRVIEAHTIAQHIYQNNLNKSAEEIADLITQALRPITFSDGLGYFFIYKMNGETVMLPTSPQLEGSSRWNLQDSQGKYILREFVEQLNLSETGEVFLNWRYYKPQQLGLREYEKLGFLKRFEPFDWLIGTGKYIGDVEKFVQVSILKRIADYKVDEVGDSYVFVIDKEGTFLQHPNKALIGESVYQLDEFGQAYNQMLQEGHTNAGFIQYKHSHSETNSELAEKISYIMPIEGWGWSIGTGFYLDDFEQYITKKESELASQLRSDYINFSVISLSTALLIVLVSLFLGHLIGKRFIRFRDSISQSYQDVVQIKNNMEQMALHDELTGLPNRIHLSEIIEENINELVSNNRVLAVVFLDLDNFKKVNDLYGHSTGDKLLQVLAKKFQSFLDNCDTVARFGGDEYVFCFPCLGNELDINEKLVEINKVFKDTFVIDGKALHSECSIGVSFYKSDADHSAATLFQNADMALSKSKKNNESNITFYDNALNHQIEQEYALEEELKRALIRNEISVVYQPQINANSMAIVGVEALARWNNGRLGFIPPNQFIKIAEDIGLIYDIGWFVFRKACEDIYGVYKSTSESLNLSVNVSPKQLLHVDCTQILSDIVKDVGIDINKITLEITENVFINDFEQACIVLEELEKAGFQISLDDFGTGYSSMRYLNSLPISEIKIDKCFVDNLADNLQSESLVKAIVAIAESCQFKLVAEGVETIEQSSQLIEFGCDIQQGYYFERPVNIIAISEWVAKRASA